MEKNWSYEKKSVDKIGILTFHCADNFGAMLQAYGLLTWLSREGFDTFIVNYVPIFLRGREWLFPYRPGGDRKKWRDFSLWLFKRNIKTGKGWWDGKRQMKAFRKEYLTKGNRVICRVKGLSHLKADLLIVGSDQIWNPEITYGFCPAYFGAFENSHIRKTIAYAASFGTAALPKEMDAALFELLASVTDISMREREAAEYVEAHFQRKASHVADPVLLLTAREWHMIEDKPKEQGFILYYETEYSEPLRRAADQLARKKNLKVIELSARSGEKYWPFHMVYSAGPAQFLGYVSAADYVFTNSFHGLAFSILMHKSFYICNHSTVGARLESLLEYTGLNSRMERVGFIPDIEERIEWGEVERRLDLYRRQSIEFLRNSLIS